jgi:outer membrane protein assembly factor BamB
VCIEKDLASVREPAKRRANQWREYSRLEQIHKESLMKNRAIILTGLVAFSTFIVTADDWQQWRGPNRDGISKETGLLKEWPKAGPKLIWQLKDIGNGYATPSVVGDRIYVLGNEGVGNEFVQALAVQDGKKIWTAKLGKVGAPDQQPSFPAARSTPTVDGDVLYALGSDGDLACVECSSGKIRWHKNLQADFGGKNGDWAYAESPLVDGDLVVCTPGGSDATILALHKTTGEVAWKCALPEADQAAYSSAIIVNAAGTRQYVQLLQKGLVGVDAKTGHLLWRYGKPVSRFNANIPTPIASGDSIYTASAGTGAGLVKVTLKDGKISSDQVYFETKLPTAIGGAVKVGDLLYGTTGKALLCLEYDTGKIKWEDPAIGPASLCLADGMLYLHGENGQVAFVEANAEGYHEKGKFTPPDQAKRAGPMEKPWAYPVVANGRLYLRDHGNLWSYEVRAGKGGKATRIEFAPDLK